RKIVLNSNPDFFEIKGYSVTGLAPRMLVRLGKELPIYEEHGELMKKALAYSPTYEEVYEFGRAISYNFKLFPFITGSFDSSQVVMAVKWKDIKNPQFVLI
ncbi:MAG: 4-demethylwyosine synthase TYW1, partial [Thermoproteota archaeon]